ncbi:MAG: hypothetical protein RLZ98_3580 [Pseudomonadota bacterium]|jgi:tripartite-type tricarboxylate transporter receptor subunit TctC
MRIVNSIAIAAVAAAGFAVASPAAAADFYKDKTLTITVGFGAGGGFDTYMRTVAQYLGRHIPGKPAIKPVNRPGAGGRIDANLLYVKDPKDGTHIALLGPWLVTEPLYGAKGVEFDPTKFNWLISTARDVSTCMFWKRSGITSYEELRKKKQVTVGSTGNTATTTTDALLINAIFGTNIKVIHGFKGTNDGFLAAERGELDGMCGMWVSSVKSRYSAPLDAGAATVILQLGTWRHPQFPKATHIIEDLKPKGDDLEVIKLVLAQLDMARPFAAPPGVPADRVAILRKAFADVVKDPDFLAEAKKRKLDVIPVSPDSIQSQIAEMYKAPKPVVERARKILGY